MRRSLFIGITLSVMSTAMCEPAYSADRYATVRAQHPEQSGFHKSGLLKKADTALARVVAENRLHSSKGTGNAFKPSSEFVRATAQHILIDARATRDGADLLNELVRLGLQSGSQYGDVVSGQLPIRSIEAALALSSLRSISASPPPIMHAGSITSQGDVALRANIARSAFLVDGTGVTVGVVSDSYDTLGGAAVDIGSGDLPIGGVPVLNGESTYCGVYVFCVDEGRAMLQIIHDVAPGADLLFQSGIEGVAAYANAITNLAANGADVIVDDLLLVNEPMFQDGPVAQAIDSIVAGGVTFVTAAGNSGRMSYEAPFDDSGEVFCIEFFEPIGDCDPIFERVGRMHDFDPGPGVDNYLNITVPVNGVMTIAMQWDQPYGGSGPTTDHDIVVLDGAGEVYREISANDNIVMGEGWEALRLDNNEVLDYGSEFSIIITYDDVDSLDPPASLVKLVIFGQDVTINEWATNSGALFGHPNANGAIATGAAFYMDTPENGTSPPVLRPFSSAGGTPTLFDVNGVRLARPEVRQAPEIVAVDGVNTTFFFDDSIGNDGIDDFIGTSAAAPHAAGVAALVLEADPTALPDELGRALQNTAVDMGTVGADFDSGYGLIQADAAVAAVLASYPKDMNGNGQADILWRNNSTGQNWLYLMNGATIDSSVGVNTVSDLNWEIVGNGDYNGDTHADVLWRNGSTGQNWMYLMNGASIAISAGVNTISDPNWQVVGNGDYDGDGNADILWRNSTTGQNWLYLMNGASIATSAGVNTISDTNWQVAGNGDFNGDGRSDILWRNSATGQNWLYLMDGASIVSSVGINTVPTEWAIAGIGDYNGDGKADILWRHSGTGQNWMYLMNGASVSSSAGVVHADVYTVPTAWNVAGSGDYNGDGNADILWRNNSTGQNWLYLMSGAVVTSSVRVNTVPAPWGIINVD